MVSDDQHFSNKKYVQTFRIPIDIGSFVVQSRLACSLFKERLNDMKFPTVGPWTYDPKEVILRLRDPSGNVSIAENPYHVPQPMTEKLANKMNFLQNKDSLVSKEKSIVLREKRTGGDLSEDLPIEKK